MQKQFSLSTYLAFFVAGCVLAVLGIGLYSALANPNAEAGASTVQAAPAPAPVTGTMSPPEGQQSTSPGGAVASDSLPAMTVYKSPSCGCCSKWVEHIESAGFTVKTRDLSDVTPKKNELGVPTRLRSCHTAKVGDYVVEGHVPAADVKRLLNERPEIAGLAVPGMPAGSPGMEVPGRPAQPYQVVAFDEGQIRGVFAQH